MISGPAFLDFPFSIDTRGRASLTDEDGHVRDLIAQVLFTAPGERVNRPEFGCGVKQLVFAPASDALAAATEQLIHGALLRWLEPVISVESVSVVAGDASIEITIAYARRDTQERREEIFRQPVAV